MAERDLDVVVLGATGVTGRHVAGYLAGRSRETGARWAPAARDAAKLDRVLGEVGARPRETILADIDEPDSLEAMAARARVVVNLAGPYTLNGRPVIEACVRAGAHYVDLSGEVQFIREVVDAFHAHAERARVKVVQACGFEALPPDLAVSLADETARERFGEGLAEADLEVWVRPPFTVPRPSDVVSGGTLHSLAAIAGDAAAATVTDPAALVPDPARASEIRRRSPIMVAPRRGAGGAVIAPMMPAAFINPAVIHRSTALRAAERDGGGEPLRYREGIALRGSPATLPLRYVAAGAMSAIQAVFSSGARAAPGFRRRAAGVLRRVLPSSGFGPAADRMAGWRWGMSLHGRTATNRSLVVEVTAEGHPGYLATARMVGEAALVLADPDLAPDRSGCLTPASAIGTAAIERFERAGVRFAVR